MERLRPETIMTSRAGDKMPAVSLFSLGDWGQACPSAQLLQEAVLTAADESCPELTTEQGQSKQNGKRRG